MSDNIIILHKIICDKFLSSIILQIFDISAMSDNIIILIYNNHANIWQFVSFIVFFIVAKACILNYNCRLTLTFQ